MHEIEKLCKEIVSDLGEIFYDTILAEFDLNDERSNFRVKNGKQRIKDYLCTLHTIQRTSNIDIHSIIRGMRND